MTAATVGRVAPVRLSLKGRRSWLAVAGFALWLLGWQLLTTYGPLAGVAGLPTAVETLDATVGLSTSSQLWASIGATMVQVAIALTIVIVVGIAVGVAMGTSAVVHALLDPISQFLRPIPAVIWLPLVLLILGPTRELAIALAVIGGVWPVLIQAQVGVRDVDPVILETGRAMCLSRRLTQTAIVLPSAIPYFATGIRIAAAFTLMLTIGAGILGGAPGLGRMILIAQQTGDASRVFGLVVWAGALGMTVNMALSALEAAAGRHREVSET